MRHVNRVFITKIHYGHCQLRIKAGGHGRVALSRQTETNMYKGLLIFDKSNPAFETGNLCLLWASDLD